LFAIDMPTLLLCGRISRAAAVCGLAVLSCALFQPAAAREFNCTVGVDYTQLTGNDYGFLDELEQRVTEYINDQTWTQDQFREEERIDCTIQITFEAALTMTSFNARLIVASRRPIYNTTVSSTVVQINDASWQFNYSQGTPLVFNLDQYDPLTSVLNFYVFMLLGYDYDTFSELGGTPYFERARRIAERAQGLSAPGWSQVGDDRGRVDLVTQVLDPRFRPLRTAYFTYHFGGLDHFVTETEEARLVVLEVLQGIEKLTETVERMYVLDVFFSAKYQELAAIFQESQQGSQAYDLLSSLDPAHMTEYNKLVQ
jgi:hypothetical protein